MEECHRKLLEFIPMEEVGRIWSRNFWYLDSPKNSE